MDLLCIAITIFFTEFIQMMDDEPSSLIPDGLIRPLEYISTSIDRFSIVQSTCSNVNPSRVTMTGGVVFIGAA